MNKPRKADLPPSDARVLITFAPGSGHRSQAYRWLTATDQGAIFCSEVRLGFDFESWENIVSLEAAPKQGGTSMNVWGR